MARGTPRKDLGNTIPQALAVASVRRKGGPGQALSSAAPCVHPWGAQACTHTHAHTEPHSCCIFFQDKKSGDPLGSCQSLCSQGIQTH